MPTAPVTESTDIDPEVRKAWEALDDREDREDLIDHVKVMRRLREGKEKATSWEQVKARLGL